MSYVSFVEFSKNHIISFAWVLKLKILESSSLFSTELQNFYSIQDVAQNRL